MMTTPSANAARGRPRRVLWAALLLAVASCAGPTKSVETRPPRPPLDPRHLEALVAAGDASTRTFDNAVAYFQDQLAASGIADGQIHRFSVGARPGSGVAEADPRAVLGRAAVLRPPADGGCLVYLTSHGAEDGAVQIGDDGALGPEALDQALRRGCGDAPTVVIVSACRSGQFADSPMSRPNRVILTATAPERDSFDCGAGSVFTFFDECLLSALPASDDWETVYERALGCIRVRERHVGVLPSEPRAVFGEAVRHLPTPWRGRSSRAVVFTPGPDRYATAGLPFGRAERQPLDSQLRGYAHARKPKAMAILPDGLAVWMDAETAGTDQPDELARLVLERCELIAGGACVLYARDDLVTALMPSGFAPFHPPMLVRTGRFDPAAVPFVPPKWRGEARLYGAAAPPKALAVSPARGVLGDGYGLSLGMARIEALAKCGADASDCVIYAEGDDVVLGWGG
jgi:hypothetical protein